MPKRKDFVSSFRFSQCVRIGAILFYLAYKSIRDGYHEKAFALLTNMLNDQPSTDDHGVLEEDEESVTLTTTTDMVQEIARMPPSLEEDDVRTHPVTAVGGGGDTMPRPRMGKDSQGPPPHSHQAPPPPHSLQTLPPPDPHQAPPPSFEDVLEALGPLGTFQKRQLAVGFLGSIITAYMTMSFVFLGFEPSHVCKPINQSNLSVTKHVTNTSLLSMPPSSTLSSLSPPSSTLSSLSSSYSTTPQIIYGSCEVTISIPANQNSSSSRRDEVITKTDCRDGRDFPGAEHTTFTSEWDLVCESVGRAEVSHLTFTLGQLTGGLIVSALADLLGRKPVLTVTSCLAFLTEAITVFAPNIYFIYVIRFFSGLFVQGLSCCFFVHGMEWMVPKHRQLYGVTICIIWVFQLLLVGGLAFFLQEYSWRCLQGAGAMTGCLFFLYPLCLHESPRWLAVRGRFKDSLRVLKAASRANGKNFAKVEQVFNTYVVHHFEYVCELDSGSGSNNSSSSSSGNSSNSNTPVDNFDDNINISIDFDSGNEKEIMFSKDDFNSNLNLRASVDRLERRESESCTCASVTIGRQSSDEVKGRKKKKDSLLELFSHRKAVVMTLTAWYLWVTHNMIYYGLYMTSSELVGNRFLNYSLMVLVEIPSNLLILYVMDKFSRRVVLRFFLSMAFLSLLASTVLVSITTTTAKGDDSSGDSNSTTTTSSATSTGSHSVLSSVLFVAGKFAISASFNVLYILTPEIFPTSLRVSGSGSCTSIDKIGSMVAPFLRPLTSVVAWGPGVVFTTVCLLALGMTLLLPETKYADLPGTLRDMDRSPATVIISGTTRGGGKEHKTDCDGHSDEDGDTHQMVEFTRSGV